MQKQRLQTKQYIETTLSICPHCRKVIEGHIFTRDNRVFMEKTCPEHGHFQALLFGDAFLYEEINRYKKPGRLPLEFSTDVKHGCPHDCGLCPDHEQHACVGLIEITSACNLDCAVCFANAGPIAGHGGFALSRDQVDFMLDRFVTTEGDPEVIQFSGGEPTLHPLLFDFIKMSREKGISYVMVNTNGIRIARDDRFLHQLSDLKPHIYLQFDGFNEKANFALRGRHNILDEKIRALDRMAEADVRVVLVAAIERGVNEDQIGPIVSFGLRHPAVFGINFQPVFRVNRHLPANPLTRITIPDVISELENQSQGMFKQDDFIPVSCCAPACHFVTYALVDPQQVTPIPRLIEVDRYLSLLDNRTIPGINENLVNLLERLWTSRSIAGSAQIASIIQKVIPGGQRILGLGKNGTQLSEILSNLNTISKEGIATERCAACRSHLPLSAHTPRDLGRHIFLVSVRDFMDPWTFDLKDVKKCCVDFLIPDGRIIPFCAYNNVGYREEATRSILADQTYEK